MSLATARTALAAIVVLLSLPAVVRAADYLPQKPAPVDKVEPTWEPFANWWTHISHWWSYTKGCLDADLLAPACRPLWAWAFGALLVVAVLVLGWMVISYIFKVVAAHKAEAARAKVADEATMRAHSWDGDKAFRADLPAEEVERRIKEALIARANEGRPPPIV